MIRPGNALAIGILTVSSGGLIARAAVALSQDRPSAPPAVDLDTSPTVQVSGFAFPESIAVDIGATVTWINNDGAPHTVTFDDTAPSPSSVDLAPSGQGTASFAEAGTFSYVCEIHPSMTGRVEVGASTAPGPTTEPYQDDY